MLAYWCSSGCGNGRGLGYLCSKFGNLGLELLHQLVKCPQLGHQVLDSHVLISHSKSLAFNTENKITVIVTIIEKKRKKDSERKDTPTHLH